MPWHGRRAMAAPLQRYGPRVAVVSFVESAKDDQGTLEMLDELVQRCRKDAT